jgi:putative tryptophan/tyrosine transport system substrate-binding protein
LKSYEEDSMKTKIKHILIQCIFIINFLLAFALFNANASSDIPKRIFILHSYEAGHICGQPQHDGVIAALGKAGFNKKENLEIEAYYMDTKRKNNTPKLMMAQASKALEKIRSFSPQVLVTLDDNAFRTVALNLVDSPISIVFSGMNSQPEYYNQLKPLIDSRSHPNHNITGVYEKLHIVDAIRVHSKLFPGLKKIRIFVDPSLTGQAISKQIEIEIKEESIDCDWEVKTTRNWEEYQAEILATNKDSETGAIYPAALLLKDCKETTYTAPEIFAWTIQNSNKPEIALNYEFTRLGLFGGAAVDFYSMGCQAGQMVARILMGENPGDIPIEDARRYALVFNIKRAEQLGITIPPDILMAADEVVLDNL